MDTVLYVPLREARCFSLKKILVRNFWNAIIFTELCFQLTPGERLQNCVIFECHCPWPEVTYEAGQELVIVSENQSCRISVFPGRGGQISIGIRCKADVWIQLPGWHQTCRPLSWNIYQPSTRERWQNNIIFLLNIFHSKKTKMI